MKTAEVIVDIGHSEVDKIFEYSAIDGVKEGCRVRVPFGRKVIDGYVMRLKEGSEIDPARLKPVAEVVDEALTPECLRLAEHLAARYHCPKAIVCRLFLPAEMRRGAVHARYTRWWRSARPPKFPPAPRRRRRRMTGCRKRALAITRGCARGSAAAR